MHDAVYRQEARPAMQHHAGFSLLELLSALALAAVLASISILGHHALRPSLNLSTAARQIAVDLKGARMRAVAENTAYRILFRSDSRSYQLQRKGASQFGDSGPPIILPAEIVVRDCSARDSAISFAPRGSAGSFGTVTIANTRGETRQIVVDIAGQVRLQ
jgi:prepilin-type N-terminal cleavage/methylation domain-containing protein